MTDMTVFFFLLHTFSNFFYLTSLTNKSTNNNITQQSYVNILLWLLETATQRRTKWNCVKVNPCFQEDCKNRSKIWLGKTKLSDSTLAVSKGNIKVWTPDYKSACLTTYRASYILSTIYKIWNDVFTSFTFY